MPTTEIRKLLDQVRSMRKNLIEVISYKQKKVKKNEVIEPLTQGEIAAIIKIHCPKLEPTCKEILKLLGERTVEKGHGKELDRAKDEAWLALGIALGETDL